jgi:orotidine-5'-phosphate decarboxylase
MVALDVPDARAAEILLDQLHDSVQIVKIGLELFTSAGPAIVKLAQERRKQVFLDLKFFDIDETVKRATARSADLGVQFLTVHAHRKTMQAAVEGKRAQPELKILAVTVLTNFDVQDVQESGSTWSVSELVVARAKAAAEVGCEGVVASGQEPNTIRQAVGQTLVIVTPGVRLKGTDAHDQARVTTPSQAIEQGSDYLVVGRPIRDAVDPQAAAQSVVLEMQAAFDRRNG